MLRICCRALKMYQAGALITPAVRGRVTDVNSEVVDCEEVICTGWGQKGEKSEQNEVDRTKKGADSTCKMIVCLKEHSGLHTDTFNIGLCPRSIPLCLFAAKYTEQLNQANKSELRLPESSNTHCKKILS